MYESFGNAPFCFCHENDTGGGKSVLHSNSTVLPYCDVCISPSLSCALTSARAKKNYVKKILLM